MLKQLRFYIAIFVLVFIVAAPVSFAANYFTQSGGKLSRGASNIVASIGEIPKTMERHIERGKLFSVIFVGPAEGIFQMGRRAIVGSYEVGTFWIPQKPILKPMSPSIQDYLDEKFDPEIDAP